jgi:CubicO group peptidase (beta-lactamase class C family)
VSLAFIAFTQQTAAQSLTFSLFERYLEALRVESGIPGLSGAIVQNGRVIWESGLGYQDVEALIRATAITPYPIEDLSSTLASTLLLDRCLDSGRLSLDDRVRRWVTAFPEESTSVGQLLRHTSPSGVFRYDPDRYSSVSRVVEQCGSQRYPRAITDEILDHVGMQDSVPSHDFSDLHSILTDSLLARYSRTLQRLAVPYRVDSNRRPIRSEYKPQRLNGSTGVVSTARDLARFDIALSAGDLVSIETLQTAWSTSGSLPTGLGWFVQRYNGEPLVWHFGLAKNSYSSLLLKVPNRQLTLILLANSDGLSAPYSLDKGDVTTSAFAKVFLRLFVP